MKILLIAVAVVSIFSISAFAEDTCKTEYWDLQIRVQNLTELSDADKEKFLSQLDKAYRLCTEGEMEQASKIVEELRQRADLKKVFSPLDGN